MDKRVIISDIDGTLADIRHRLHYIRNPDGSKGKDADWDAFHHACVHDTPYEDVVEVVNTLWLGDANRDVYFLSGRNDVVEQQTIDWLEKHFPQILYAELHMRKSGDRRPDTLIKLEMVQRLGLTPDKVLCIFDDRQCVVDMWRANGYRCLQVAAWKE